MRTSIFMTAFVLSCTAGAQSRGAIKPDPAGPYVNMAAVQTVEGAIASVNLAYGGQNPSIEVAKRQIKIAPVWFFLARDFELRVGDPVRAEAAPSRNSTDPYLYAIRITNTATNDRIALRDSAGLPLWSGFQGSSAQAGGSGGGSACVDANSIVTVSGTIDGVTYGPGIQFPTLTLQVATGELAPIQIGPEHVLLAADLELKSGQRISARVAHSVCRDEWLALDLTLEDGRTIMLRTDDFRRAWD